ncbi:MAG: hypothetical protein LBK69_08560 [Syntrophomonadaceae bacterium]|nr:hypothetical protein [Syntrophomonadaceae bacterium]
MSNKHTSKMITPIIITAGTVIYIMFWVVFILFSDFPIGIKLLTFLITIALAGASVYVLAERIKEIRSGEYDDLSKY